MHERDLLPILLLTLAVAPLLARAVGWLIAAHLRAEPGKARRWMPTLPELPVEDGTPAARFDAAVRRAERRALPLLAARAVGGQVRAIDADALAAELTVPVPVATALLDDWRHRLPSRLRVTRGGRLLHDFPARALAGAVRSGWHALPQRMALMAAAVLANLGALWWVVVGVAVGVASLGAVLAAWDAGEEAMVVAALGGVLAVGLVFGISQLGAWLVRLATWRSAPPMAAPQERLKRRKRGAAQAEAAPIKPSKSTWFDGADLSGLGDISGEGCLFVIGAAAVAFLLTAVLGGLAVVGIWVRGLWQAAGQLGEPIRDLGPATWLRQAQPTPVWEQWVPTNDLAIRLVRALGRLLQLRPSDEQLAGRILGRAKAQGGRVSALEIALDNALDLNEAMSVATRLVARLGGDIEVSEAGDLDFIIAADALRGADAMPDTAALEYLSYGGDGGSDDSPLRLPVNVPGLTQHHVLGATRLAGGPLATVAVMAVFIVGEHGDLPIRGLDLSLGALFCVLAPGTLMLAAATRQAVAESAAQGLLRDVRRITVWRAVSAMRRSAPKLVPSAVAAELWATIRRTGMPWSAGDIEREVEATLADLGLEPGDADGRGEISWSLRPLRERAESVEALRAQASSTAQGADADEVVFDSGALEP